MYLSRPPIDGGSSERGPQLAQKNTPAGGAQTQKATTLAVKDRGHELRHPSTRKFQGRETTLGLTDINGTADRDSQDKSDLPGNEY